MSQKSPSQFGTQSQKKKYGGGVFGDVYGIMMLPKELELEKEVSPPFELRFQVPDFRVAIQNAKTSPEDCAGPSTLSSSAI